LKGEKVKRNTGKGAREKGQTTTIRCGGKGRNKMRKGKETFTANSILKCGKRGKTQGQSQWTFGGGGRGETFFWQYGLTKAEKRSNPHKVGNLNFVPPSASNNSRTGGRLLV